MRTILCQHLLYFPSFVMNSRPSTPWRRCPYAKMNCCKITFVLTTDLNSWTASDSRDSMFVFSTLSHHVKIFSELKIINSSKIQLLVIFPVWHSFMVHYDVRAAAQQRHSARVECNPTLFKCQGSCAHARYGERENSTAAVEKERWEIRVIHLWKLRKKRWII